MSFSIPESIVSSLVEKRYWISDGIFPLETTLILYRLAFERAEAGLFRPAKIGKGIAKTRAKEIRGDLIHWIEDWDSTEELQTYSEFLDELSRMARRELFLSIRRHESHFAVYPPGARYRPHRDRHRKNPRRLLTCVYYLSEWNPGYGGELLLYTEKKPSPKSNGFESIATARIEPQRGRFIVFDSSLYHEVLPAKESRWSLTSWLRDDAGVLP